MLRPFIAFIVITLTIQAFGETKEWNKNSLSLDENGEFLPFVQEMIDFQNGSFQIAERESYALDEQTIMDLKLKDTVTKYFDLKLPNTQTFLTYRLEHPTLSAASINTRNLALDRLLRVEGFYEKISKRLENIAKLSIITTEPKVGQYSNSESKFDVINHNPLLGICMPGGFKRYFLYQLGQAVASKVVKGITAVSTTLMFTPATLPLGVFSTLSFGFLNQLFADHNGRDEERLVALNKVLAEISQLGADLTLYEDLFKDNSFLNEISNAILSPFSGHSESKLGQIYQQLEKRGAKTGITRYVKNSVYDATSNKIAGILQNITDNDSDANGVRILTALAELDILIASIKKMREDPGYNMGKVASENTPAHLFMVNGELPHFHESKHIKSVPNTIYLFSSEFAERNSGIIERKGLETVADKLILTGPTKKGKSSLARTLTTINLIVNASLPGPFEQFFTSPFVVKTAISGTDDVINGDSLFSKQCDEGALIEKTGHKYLGKNPVLFVADEFANGISHKDRLPNLCGFIEEMREKTNTIGIFITAEIEDAAKIDQFVRVMYRQMSKKDTPLYSVSEGLAADSGFVERIIESNYSDSMKERVLHYHKLMR